MKISLILPVYNPVSGWADTVLIKTAELKAIYPGYVFEVIIVNDGSNNDDYTFEKAKISSFNLIDYMPNKGKGEAIRTGVRASSGEVVIYTDIDFPYTIYSISSVIDSLCEQKFNVVIGVKDRSYYDLVPPVRRFISRLFRFFVRLFLHIPTDDTQCGLKGFDQKGKEVFLKTTIDRYLFDLEFVFLASGDKDVKVKTQEVKLRDDVQFRKMNLSILRSELWNFLKILMHSYIG